MPTAPPTPARSLATLLAWLGRAVAARNAQGLLTTLLIGLLAEQFRQLEQCLARLAELIRDGRYVAPIAAPPSRQAEQPRRTNPAPQNSLLLPPMRDAAADRTQAAPRFAGRAPQAPLAAAPASRARALRRKPGAAPPPPPRPEAPKSLRTMPRQTWIIARMGGKRGPVLGACQTHALIVTISK